MSRVECWDMDETILNTIGWLYQPVSMRIAEACGQPVAVVAAARERIPIRTINFFRDWFAELGLQPASWAALEADLRTDIAIRAQYCLYPGIRELLERRRRAGVRMVLITAGDAGYQAWKFSHLGLDHIFAAQDRYFVPLDGSKASVITRFLKRGHVTFIDDTQHWHHELIDFALGEHVNCIRPRWPGSTNEARHLDDDELWHTATSADEIERLL